MTLDKSKIEKLAAALINDTELCERIENSSAAAPKATHTQLTNSLLAMDGNPYLYLYQSSTWYSPVDQAVSSWLTIVNPGPTPFDSYIDTLLVTTFFGPLPALADASQAPAYRDIRLPMNGYGGIVVKPYSYAGFDITIPLPCDYPVSTKSLSRPSTMCGEPYGTIEPICGDTLILNFMLWSIHQESEEWLQPVTQTTSIYDIKTVTAKIAR